MATRESLSEHTDMSEISAEWDILIYVSVEQDGRETNHMCQVTFRAVQFISQHV